jgi:ABC-type glycerol-3-phosphate transport system substrate-binding protein
MPRPKRKKESYTQVYVSTIAIPTYSKHQDEGVEFLKWITTAPEPQEMFMKAGTWGISTQPEVARTFSTPGKPPSDQRDPIVPETPFHFGGLLKTTFGPELRNFMKPATEQVWTGQKSAKEAFGAIADEVDEILREARERNKS